MFIPPTWPSFQVKWSVVMPDVLFALVLSAVFALQYYRSKDRGFIWLWVALVLWPLNGLILMYFYVSLTGGGIALPGVLMSPVVTTGSRPPYPSATISAFNLGYGIYRYGGYLLTVLAALSLYRNCASRPATATDANERAGNP